MLLITCPFCGERPEIEFRYRGDATVERPAADAPIDAFHDYVFARENPKGMHAEWWQHVHGCRAVFRRTRNTLTHEWVHESPES
jgi:methylglutamate dehydrogenase subunit B